MKHEAEMGSGAMTYAPNLREIIDTESVEIA
jgi:hypothetical protein